MRGISFLVCNLRNCLELALAGSSGTKVRTKEVHVFETKKDCDSDFEMGVKVFLNLVPFWMLPNNLLRVIEFPETAVLIVLRCHAFGSSIEDKKPPQINVMICSTMGLLERQFQESSKINDSPLATFHSSLESGRLEWTQGLGNLLRRVSMHRRFNGSLPERRYCALSSDQNKSDEQTK